MDDSPQTAALTELPYGTRQRIVVVPDAVLDADSAESDGDRSRRPWDVLRSDPRHPTLSALREANDEGLRLLPVKQSDIGQLDMPVGHPLPNLIYIGSPAVAERYYPLADFHLRVFEERFGEAIRLLMALGAQRLIVRSQHGWKRDISASLEAPVKMLRHRAELRIGSRRDRSLVFEASLAPVSVPETPADLVWFGREPTWKAVADGRTLYGLREFQLQVTSREDFGITAEFASKVRHRRLLALGGNYARQVDTSWSVEGTFGELPKRGRRRF